MKKLTAWLTLAVATCTITASPVAVSAGGLLGDLIEGACGNCGVGRSLDESHKQIGSPLDSAAGNWMPGSQSTTCVTPSGTCEVSNSIRGTTCFCGTEKNPVLGRMQ